MNKVKILTDSCSDLNGKLLDKYDIDYCQMKTVYEGVQSPADLRWTDEDVHKLYNIVRDGNRITTTQVPVEEFQKVFTKYLDQGFDIVYIGCSLKQSGSVNTGAVVAKGLLPKYPNQKIFCIDSLNACIGEGMIAIEAAKFNANGDKSADEINEFVLGMRKTVNEFCTVHTLDYMKRAGRVKASTAFFGNLMGVKPILIADKEGSQVAYKKVKGRGKSFEEITNLMKESVTDITKNTIYIAHADCSEEEVNKLKEIVLKEIPGATIDVVYIGPIVGACIGPDAIGLWSIGKEVTWTAGDN
ncbi:MAG: DegV family protein [Treponema sp.]|nr:DegV family protein [Treponema sp.]